MDMFKQCGHSQTQDNLLSCKYKRCRICANAMRRLRNKKYSKNINNFKLSILKGI